MRKDAQLLYSFPTFSMGQPKLPLEKPLALAAELEDEELLRALRRRGSTKAAKP